MSDQIKKIDYPEDPRRCQDIGANGQCQNVCVEGARFCRAHNSYMSGNIARAEAKLYKLRTYNDRLKQLSSNNDAMTLKEEIGLARIALEAIVNQCSGDNDLVMYSSKIGDLVTRIQKLVQACHALDKSTGVLLDKTVIVHLAGSMITIIGKYIEDPETIGKIGEELFELVKNAQPRTTSSGKDSD